MIILFGPAGAGKSVQGQILSARYGWRWLSAGQLLRDSKDKQLHDQMLTGDLVDNEAVNRIMSQAIKRAHDIDRLVLDGFPRVREQAEWLVASQQEHERAIDMVIVLEVPRHEVLRRLHIRGRADDTDSAIQDRLHIYRTEIYPILGYFTDCRIPITHIDGTGTVGQVHDRIAAELTAHHIIKE